MCIRDRQSTWGSSTFSQIYYLQREDFIKQLSHMPVDKEKFCFLKDEASFKRDLTRLKIVCYICHQKGHVAKYCNEVHYIPSKLQVAARWGEIRKNIFRRVLRSPDCRYHSLVIRPMLADVFRKEGSPAQEEANQASESSPSVQPSAPSPVMKLKLLKPAGRSTFGSAQSESLSRRLPVASPVVKKVIRHTFPALQDDVSGYSSVKTLRYSGHEEEELDTFRNYEIYFPDNNLLKILAQAPSLIFTGKADSHLNTCLLYTSPSPRDRQKSRMPSSA
eukprot:TRINITY_DN5921_c0_g2_i1.p1 TRINITY_DN5921_c0_g2~~TRINITY_DN5921_c0_g2_i1.p1  ORF type:complete len:276 (-),score=41.84 TRINITY_DN5921_c0_g2_i1:11-838(-)